MPASFDDVFASLFSKMLSRLAGQATHPGRLTAGYAIRSVRLMGPAGRIPFPLVCVAGADSPAEGLLSHMRLWQYAPLTPVFRSGWRPSVFAAQRVQEVAQVGTPIESGDAIRPAAMPVWFPGARAVGETHAFGQASFMGPRWHTAEPATAEPMEARGDNLPACGYHTRSMLLARLQGGR